MHISINLQRSKLLVEVTDKLLGVRTHIAAVYQHIGLRQWLLERSKGVFLAIPLDERSSMRVGDDEDARLHL